MESDNTGAWIGFALVGVIILVGLIYFFSGGEEEQTTQPTQQQVEQTQEQPTTPEVEEEDETEDEEKETSEKIELPDSVKSYVQLARRGYVAPDGQEKYRHEFTRKRLEALGTAIVDMGETFNGDGNRLEQIRNRLETYGAEIQEDWTDRHSDDVRKAFLETYDAFDFLKRKSGRIQLDLTDLRSRAESIDPDELYLEQKSKAVAFFQETATLFDSLEERMN